jgi:membrane-bound ClpP family serine protease
MGLVITLIVIGIILILLELIVIPGVGVTGILGLASLVGGIVLAYTSHGAVTGHIILLATIIFCGICLWIVLRSKTWNRLSLKTNIEQRVDTLPEQKGIKVGDKGVALTRLAPMGKIRVNDIDLEATSRDNIINANQPIEVVKVDGTKVLVIAV